MGFFRRCPILLAAALTGAFAPQAADHVVTPVEGPADAAIQKALEQARPGDRVVLRAGEYRLGGAVRFPRAGEEGRPVTLCAAGGEYVALLGSVRLAGWEEHKGKIWKAKHPAKPVKGLYEDAERLTHPRPDWSRREDPPVSELRAPGTWTQDGEWVYCWTREGDTPDNHRIEASQGHVVVVDKPFVRVEGLHLFFGQHLVCEIAADHSEVVRCEIAHCSNSVDNSYNAYFSGCSNSAFRECLIHDSFYWGDHGSNSHVLSCIDCGDRGPNFVDRCEIFNGGLGVGTKGAAREMVVMNSLIYDVVHGVVFGGGRSSGPGAGKADRGHYVVWRNRFVGCGDGGWIYSGDNRNTRIWNNLFEGCGTGVAMRNYLGEPKKVEIANNIFSRCGVAVEVTGGRDGKPTLGRFVDAGLVSHGNLYWQNGVAWRNPLTWGTNLDMTPAELPEKFPPLGKGDLAADPKLDEGGRPAEGSPALGAGAEIDLPSYLPKPETWDIGPGGGTGDGGGLALSIAGSPGSVGPGEEVKLRAVLANGSGGKEVDLGGERDCILTFHFRYRGGHLDKQELFRVRVQLPGRKLMPGEKLDLATLPGWRNPVNGKLGDDFHLRTDTKAWAAGCRLSATARLVGRGEETARALQRLEDLVRSKEVLKVALR